MPAERVRNAFLLALALLLLAGCGEGEAGDIDTAAFERIPEAERYGGTAILPTISGLTTMNPLVVGDYGSQVAQRSLLFTPLVRYDENLEPMAGIAERWDTVRVAPDTLEITFHLRRDLRWHDGEPVTAEDVLFTFERMTDPRVAYPGIARLAHWSRRAELLDSHTLRFRLRPHPEFLEVWYVTPVVPRHILGSVPPEELRTHPFGTQAPVGNGPFRFVRHVANQEWVFEANPDYPESLGGRPYLDRVVYRHVPDATTTLTEVLTGRVDEAGLRPEQVERVRAAPNVRVVQFTIPQWTYIGWNTRLPLFEDARVRRALTMALDRQAIVDGVLYGIPEVGRSPVTPAHWAFAGDDPQTWVPYDPEGARRLLAEAGWTPGPDGILRDASGRRFSFTVKTRLGNDSWREITEIMQAQYARLGIEVRPQLVEGATLVQHLQGRVNAQGERVRNFEAVVLNWVEAFGKDDSPLLHSRSRNEPQGYVGYANPEADRLLDTLAVIVDREEARPFWIRYQRLMASEVPYTVLYYGKPTVAVSNRLQGVQMDARGDLATVQRWWIPPSLRRETGRAGGQQ
ncbi:MAG TPA: ABC transporter substrate-binding protein [Longimicrobiaceae bacterium]|nr:ABC transporter substrate-binding protein [Longimicrobiaceae bacterium]